MTGPTFARRLVALVVGFGLGFVLMRYVFKAPISTTLTVAIAVPVVVVTLNWLSSRPADPADHDPPGDD